MSRLSGEALKKRICNETEFFLRNAATVRKTAIEFEVGKSTIHRDLTKLLKQINPRSYYQVRILMNLNKKIRHIRGGEATRKKYILLKKQS